jgi:hypothetical protein
MRRTQLLSLMALIVAVPVATAGTYFGGVGKSSGDKPCFIAGSAGYRFSGAKSGGHVIRIDNAAIKPSLRMQLVDNPAQADFVLIDDTDNAGTCDSASKIESIRLDPAAARPDLTVTLSRQPADYKIFVQSAHFTDEDAAALFAVMWYKANATGSIASVAKND